ncbi:unnamed protein product [Sympodiomycopsis kandeliae]
MSTHTILPADQIPTIDSPDSISPILLRLLECPVSLLPTLSSQVLTSLQDLPDEDRPTSYEGLLDVARFCVEEDPGWKEVERAQFIGGHPRIGRQKGAISKDSQKEQGAESSEPEEIFQKLEKLNYLYERRYPTLRFVTYVAGRSRKLVADELEQLLGHNTIGLPPSDAAFNLDSPQSSGSWQGFPKTEVKSVGSPEWSTELHRGEDALWEIAGDRAGKLTAEVSEKGSVTIQFPSEAQSTAETEPAEQPVSEFDIPFLSQATFRALVLASPVLHTFFEQELPNSFFLSPVEKHTSTKDAFLSALNDAGQGGRGVTRERVKGLLGGLLGDVADAVGNRFQQQTISGPKPSFTRSRGGQGVSLEEATRTSRNSAGGKLAPVSPAALSAKTSMQSLQEKQKSREGQDATEALRLAQEALSQRDTNQFVIDAPGDETEDAGAEVEEAEDDLDIGSAGLEGSREQGRVTGKEAQLAKELRSAEAQ